MALNLDETRRLLQEQARIGRVSVRSPGGTATFSGPDSNQLTIAPTPEQQKLQDLRQGTGIQAGRLGRTLADRLGGLGVGQRAPGVDFGGLPQAGQALDASGLPQRGQAIGTGDLSGAGQFTGLAGAGRAEQNIFERGSRLLAPQQEQEVAQARTELAARGIPEGSERGREVLDNINRRQGLARENLALSSTAAGGQEASRIFGDLLGLGQQRIGQQGQRFGQQGQLREQGAAEQGQRFGQQNLLRGQGLQESLLQRGIFGEDASRALGELGTLQQQSQRGALQPVSFGPGGIDLGAGVAGAQRPQQQSFAQQAGLAGIGLFGDIGTATRGFGLFDKGGFFGSS